ncbi:hypothetical protein AJ79_02210 [Helicocarpus griseus UAMH5409]|uniref:Uncharacterized protein n=1 Tax=Helicocarpus griseus UAMH5409 TaxID=1447875 RepID=A0A2B7Y3V3_9EURO|nr:hypothetical protein AJ79_02210 [Helicocarpus griseus UAMH5409]
MSSESTPIAPAAFAEALKSLTLPSLYAKASELRNSIAHLQRSNAELARYIAEDAPGGRDAECEEAIGENEGVMERMRERIGLLKEEVEGRGARWSEELEMGREGDGDGESAAPAAAGSNGVNGNEGGAGTRAASSNQRAGAGSGNGTAAGRSQEEGGDGQGGVYL